MFSFLPPTPNGHSLSPIVKNTPSVHCTEMLYVKNSNVGKGSIICKSGADRSTNVCQQT